MDVVKQQWNIFYLQSKAIILSVNIQKTEMEAIILEAKNNLSIFSVGTSMKTFCFTMD